MRDIIKYKLFGGGGSGGGSGGGGGATAVSPKEVNFYDYDGTCVYAYTVAEAQKLSELPAGPEHSGLVFQGWNWSLDKVKSLTRAMNIGAMYTTDDGTTRLYITLLEGRTSPMLGVGVKGTVTVDWGDGTEPDVLTGNYATTTKWTPNHNYATPGDYVIRLTVDGEMTFSGVTSSDKRACILRYSKDADVRNNVYQNALKKLEIGNGVTSIEDSAFHNCNSLVSIAISAGITNIKRHVFNECSSLVFVTIPDGITSVRENAICNCHSLASVSIPYGVTSIKDTAFFGCYSLAHVTIPDGVTTIERQGFASCLSFGSVTIPGEVTSIGPYAFSASCGVFYYDFTACTSVPALSNTNAFSGISADCEIRVPAALYDEWIAATNWATYASQIVAY